MPPQALNFGGGYSTDGCTWVPCHLPPPWADNLQLNFGDEFPISYVNSVLTQGHDSQAAAQHFCFRRQPPSFGESF